MAALSAERLATFRRPGDNDAAIVTRYVWNVALGMAMTPLLHAIEVTLRNTIDRAGTLQCPPPCRHRGVPCWLDAEPSLLASEDARMVAIARDALRRRGKPLTPGRLVAELSFGFWTRLLRRPYDQGTAKHPGAGCPLWTATNLKQAFPNMPSRAREREQLHQRYNAARVFRNRVSHHEPIFHLDLPKMHRELTHALAWMNLDAARTIQTFDQTLRVWTASPRLFRARCATLFAYTADATNVRRFR
jgi:hypothetical protein